MAPAFLLSLLISSALAAPPAAVAAAIKDAQVKGDTYFGATGRKARIKLGKTECELFSEGDAPPGEMPGSFQIVFKCGEKRQIIWDLARQTPEDLAFDDPGFELRWAGDQDGDRKIDLKMNLSQKYSCTRETVLLSSLARGHDLVTVQGEPKMVCGD
jgi:hypothetical protein